MQLFEPGPELVYPIEVVVRLTHIPRHTIAVYCKHGLVTPVADPECSGWFFDDEAIRIMRHVEYLQRLCGVNIHGARMLMELTEEVDRLRREIRFMRGW